MAKFKIGDKVRILDGSKIENYTGRWASLGSMNKYIGTIQTIESIDEEWSCGRVSYNMEGVDYLWDERGLELVTKKKQKIVITTDGRVTKATMYEGKQRIKVATSTCHPNDEFDFTKGATIAFERLTGQKCGKVETTLKSKCFDWEGFKAGKFNVIVNRNNIGVFLGACETHDINWPRNKATEWNPIERMDAEPESVKIIMKIMLCFDSTDKCDLKVIGGNLEYSFSPDMRDETVIYD